MLSRPLAFVLLAAACVVAAGGGAYLALRENAASRPPAVAEINELTQPVAHASTPAVQETEGVVGKGERVAEALTRSETATRPTAGSAEPSRPAISPTRAASSSRVTSAPPLLAKSSEEPPTQAPADPGWSSLEKPWPSRDAGGTLEAGGAAAAEPLAGEAHAPVEPSYDPAPPPEVPDRVLEELVVFADSVIGLQIDTPLNSERAKVEDAVEARVTRDVRVGDRTAIPAGTLVRGSVVLVERGGKVKERARLGLRFHTLVLADGTRVPIQTETVYREGESPAAESAAKIGGAAVGGAILGAIFGGRKGAVVGGSVGAAGGTAAVMGGDRNAATLPAGATLTVRLSAPVTITVEK